MTERERRRGYNGLLALALLYWFGLGTLKPVVPLYATAEFAVGVLLVSWIQSAFGLGKIAGNVPAGVWMDRIGRRRLIIIGLLVVALMDVASAQAATFPQFLACRLAAGFGMALVVTTALTCLLDLSPDRVRGQALSLFLLCEVGAAGLGAAAGGWLYEIGPTLSFYVKAGAAVAAIAGVWPWLPAHFRSTPTHLTFAPPQAPVLSLREPGLSGILIVAGGRFFAGAAIVGPLWALFLSELRVSAIAIGLLFAVINGGQLIGLFAGGRASDRLGRVRILALGLAGFALGLGLAVVSRALVVQVAASALIGVGMGLSQPMPTAYLGDLYAGAARARAISWLRTAQDLGLVFGPVLLGAIAQQFSIAVAVVVSAVLLAALAAMAARLPGPDRPTAIPEPLRAPTAATAASR